MKKFYVFRGLPGSGKSTLANKLAALVVEPDMFRYDEEKRYVFNSDMNESVYIRTAWLLRYAMESLDIQCLAVAATNVTINGVKEYIDLGKEHGYDVIVVECYGDYGNIHDVPQQVITKMAREFQPLTDGDAARLGVSVRRVGLKSRTMWVAMYVDTCDTCDGVPRSLGAFETEEQALKEVESDIETYLKNNPGYHRSDLRRLSVVSENEDADCTWSVTEVNIPA